MIFVWGTRLYGKVDEVPGLFHVATKFFHIWFLPLIPLGSHVVIEKSWNKWRGVPITLSGKSTLIALARVWLFAGALFVGFLGLLFLGGRPPHLAASIITELFAVLLLAGGIAAWVVKSARHATYERAVQLAEKVQVTEEGLVLLELAYGRVSSEDANATLERLRADAMEIERLKELQKTPTAPPTSPPKAPPTSPRR